MSTIKIGWKKKNISVHAKMMLILWSFHIARENHDVVHFEWENH